MFTKDSLRYYLDFLLWEKTFAIVLFFATTVVSNANASPEKIVASTDIVFCCAADTTYVSKTFKIGNFQILNDNLISFSDFQSCITLLKVQAHSPLKQLRENVPITFVLVPNNNDDLDAELVELNNVLMHWKRHDMKHRVWHPVIFILWPQILNGMNKSLLSKSYILQVLPSYSLLGNDNDTNEIFSLDNQLYFLTLSNYEASGDTDNEKQRKCVAWDIYSVNSEFFVEKIIDSAFIQLADVTTLSDILSVIHRTGRKSFIARRNFQQLPLRVSGVSKNNKVNVADFDYERINNTSIKFTDGFTVRLLWDLRDSLNFTVIGHVSHRYMSLDSENGVTGVGKLILDNEIDLTIALHSALPWRAQYVDYLQPVHTEQLGAFFQQPPSSEVRNIFLWPFQPFAWLTFGLLLLLIMVALILTKQIQEMLISNENKYIEYTKSYVLDLDDIFVQLVSIASLQGWKEVPNCNVARLILISGLFLCYTMYLCYSGSIVSALTLKVTPITDFAHFLQYGYNLLATEEAYSFYMAVPEKTEAKKLLYDTKKYYINENDTMNKILAENSLFASVSDFAEHYHTAKVLNISRKVLCQLTSFGFGPPTASVGMVIQKGSALKQFLHTKTILSIERGLGHVLKMRYHESIHNPCQRAYSKLSEQEKSCTSFHNLSFEDSKLMFIVTLSGILLSLVVFIVERIFKFE